MRLPIEKNITQLEQEGLPVFRNGTERPHKRVELKYFDSNRRSNKTSVTYVMSNYQRKVQTYSYTSSPWVYTGNSQYQQVPGHHHQQRPLLVHPYWGCSNKRKPDSGVPAKIVPQKSSWRPRLQWYAPGEASAVWCPLQLLEQVQWRAARYVTNNYTDRWPGTVASMLKNLKWSSLEQQRWQLSLGDALQNQHWPCRHKTRQLLLTLCP